MNPLKTPEEIIAQGIFDKFEALVSHKQELHDIFHFGDEYSKILSMMKYGEIISSAVHEKIMSAIVKLDRIKLQCSISTNQSEKEYKQGYEKLINFIDKYPLVADSDGIGNDKEYKYLQDDNIFVIYRGDGIGLTKKIDNGNGDVQLKSILVPRDCDRLSCNDYKKYGLIYLRDGDPKVSFCQIQKNGDIKNIAVINCATRFNGFDKDNIGCIHFHNDKVSMLHLFQSKKGDLHIEQIGPIFEKYPGVFSKFDEDNSMYISVKNTGGITLKKIYDKEGKLVGIDAFEHLLGEKSIKTDKFCRKIKDSK